MTREQLIKAMETAFLASKDIRGRDMQFKLVSSELYNGDIRKALAESLDALDAAGMAVLPVEGIYQHRKGGTYDSLGAARIQSDEPLKDMDEVVVYRAHADGSLWARRKSEFEDGRFSSAGAPMSDLVKIRRAELPKNYYELFKKYEKSNASVKALEAAMRRLMNCNKPFTMKPIGGEGSSARLDQEEQIAAHRAATLLLEQKT